MVTIKVGRGLIFSRAGISYVEPANWQPYTPVRLAGHHGRAAVVFFAYIGFDAVSTTAEEAKNPQRDSADRDYRVARRLHAAVPRRRRRCSAASSQ
jgi:amino acid transporter